MGIQSYDGEWSSVQTLHLLKRTLFGVTPEEFSNFAPLNLQQSLDKLIQESTILSPPINDYSFDPQYQDEDIEIGDPWIEAPAGKLDEIRIQSLKAWMVGNILSQGSTIHEKMVLFWHNLLVTQFIGVMLPKASWQYCEMLHENALGSYRNLIKRITIDPSMLYYLNGGWNKKEAPDENYARELQELFCLGKGPDSRYTEEDVRSAARVLTGWYVPNDQVNGFGALRSQFIEQRHDSDDKRFSDFYGNAIITGRKGKEGANETDELIDLILNQEETSRYICRRLFNFFVDPIITEDIEDNVIRPLAKVFRDSDFEIIPVLKVLFSSEVFYDKAFLGATIKTPADSLLGLCRTLGWKQEAGLYERFLQNTELLEAMSRCGMELGEPPSVAGWKAFYQEPSFDKLWITTQSIQTRSFYQDYIINSVDLTEFVRQFDTPEDPRLLIIKSAELLLGIELDDGVISELISALLAGQQNELYWTSAWKQFVSDPGNVENKGIVEVRLKSLYKAMIHLEEYQLF